MTIWRKYSLGIAFMALFLITWILMTWGSWNQFVAEQHEHNQSAEVFGESGYIWTWMNDTFANWQSDLLGQGLMVIFAAYWLYQGSSQSRDSDEQMQQGIQRIEQRLERLEQGLAHRTDGQQAAVGGVARSPR